MAHSDDTLSLGQARPLRGNGATAPLALPTQHLTSHGVIVGMTGSGKTGLVTVFVEEALEARVPVLMVDVKGDLTNLALAFPTLSSEPFVPWAVEPESSADARTPEERARDLAAARRQELEAWGIGEAELQRFHDSVELRVFTPGAPIAERLHLLAALERRSPTWDTHPDEASRSLCAAVSMLMRLLGRDPDPLRSREHVLVSFLAERRLRAGQDVDLAALVDEIMAPPVETIGALAVDDFVSRRERAALNAALNGLLTSPSFQHWREGQPFDVGAMLAPRDGRTPAVVLSVAHLSEAERGIVMGLVFDELLAYTHTLSGTQKLRALVVLDEAYGFLPPHPQTAPTKRSLMMLLKQARAYGVGILLATQNPMDVDYRALSNAGVWCVGRLQTDADRRRVVDALASTHGTGRIAPSELSDMIERLAPRWFVMRDALGGSGLALMQPRCAYSWLRGPLTREELRRVAGGG